MNQEIENAQLLTSEAVHEIAKNCMFEDGEDQSTAIIVDAIVTKFGFNPERIEKNREKIASMLKELPDSFHTSKGGGMSFLAACMDRHGNHWAEHRTMALLFALGQAAGLAKCLLPREVWGKLPGEMPYYSVEF